MADLLPRSASELAASVAGSNRLHVPLLGSAPDDGADVLRFDSLKGEIRHDVADGVVSCLAGTTLRELNTALALEERCIPYGSVWPVGSLDLSLAALILLGLPHSGEAVHGTWRDWLLGASMVTVEGCLVKSGSRVVKSVAGYDAHKLLVGSRGALMLPAEVILRTYHLRSAVASEEIAGGVRSILRVRVSDLQQIREELGSDALGVDEGTGTVWSSRPVEWLPESPFGWSMDPFCPTIEAKTLALQKRAKVTLDPTGKLAPGAFRNL